MRDVASSIVGEIGGVLLWHISLGDERVDVELRDGTVKVGNQGGIIHAASLPASTAVTAFRSEPEERMTNFSASTIRKKTTPPASSHGQMRNGTASVPKIRWK